MSANIHFYYDIFATAKNFPNLSFLMTKKENFLEFMCAKVVCRQAQPTPQKH